jgi:CysZ protein
MTSIPPAQPQAAFRTEPTLPRHPITQMIWGASFPWRALGFIAEHELWLWASFAVLINIVLLAGIITGVIWYVMPWLSEAQARLGAMAADGQTLQMAVRLLVWALWIMVVPLIFVGSTVVVLLFGQLFSSPFLDMLSEKVECIQMGSLPQQAGFGRFVGAAALAFADCVWGIVYLGAVYIPLLLLGFVPGVGALVSLVAGSMVVSQQFLGLVLSRHLVSYRARWSCILQNKWPALGFGAMTTLMLALPGIDLLLLPLATVGGTMLACALWRADRLAPTLWAPPIKPLLFGPDGRVLVPQAQPLDAGLD